jgi:hypothetical protein
MRPLISTKPSAETLPVIFKPSSMMVPLLLRLKNMSSSYAIPKVPLPMEDDAPRRAFPQK